MRIGAAAGLKPGCGVTVSAEHGTWVEGHGYTPESAIKNAYETIGRNVMFVSGAQ